MTIAGNVFGCVIILLLTLAAYVYRWFRRSHEYFDKYRIPYVKPTILVGNIGDGFFKKKPLPWVQFDLYRKLEPYRFAGYFNFHTPYMIIRDPVLIRHIMVKDFEYFCDRGFGFNTKSKTDRLGSHLLALKGEEWKNLRVKLTSTFTSGKMKLMFPHVKTCGDHLARVLDSLTEEPFDVTDLCARFTTDVIGSTVFGIETRSLEDPKSEFRVMGNRIFEFRLQSLITAAFPNLPQSLIKLFNLNFVSEEIQEFFLSIVENTVKHREQNKVTRNDFIDILLSLKNETMAKYKDEYEEEDLDQFLSQVGTKHSKNSIEMTVDLMAAQCVIFFGAGFETSSTALGFLMFELAIHQDIQNKLRDEINTAIKRNEDGLTYELLSEMPYLDMVITEIMRKYPATGFIDRQCTADYLIPNTDVVIPKGIKVTIPILGLHRDPKYYEKPGEFYPEHFTKEAIANRPHYTYLPFGEGPRACIGERFAKMQIKVGLISMVRNYSFELSSKTELPIQYQQHFILIKAKTGLWFHCRKILA